MCIPIRDKSGDTAAKTVCEHWIQYFGPSLVIIPDQGPEFMGQEFKDRYSANSIMLHATDVRTPWQNGRAERHGDIFKKILEEAMWLQAPSSADAFKIMIAECNAAKNRLSNKSRCSLLQHVLGMSHRLPAGLASDDRYVTNAIYDLAATGASFEKSRRIREAALEAQASVAAQGRVQAAVRARTRRSVKLRSDDVAMVWKSHPPLRRDKWTGSGVCIGTHRSSIWVSTRGSLWKCAREQCRLATTEQSRGLEIQNMLLQNLKVEFEKFLGRRTFVDVEREGALPEDANIVLDMPEVPEDQDEVLVPPEDPAVSQESSTSSLSSSSSPRNTSSKPEPEWSQADEASFRGALGTPPRAVSEPVHDRPQPTGESLP